MKQYTRARRVGLAAILLALVLRLYLLDVPGILAERNIAPLSTEPETGQDVRFLPSFGTFLPDFVESFGAAAKELPIPVFSREEEVALYYAADRNPDIPALLEQPLEWSLLGEEARVLILHTHATESYTKQEEVYVETSSWRTLDEHYNMISLGAEVARLLAMAGIASIHDTTLHDYPSYNGSYTHARKTMKDLLKENPHILLVLDLHRDASGGEGGQLRTKALVDGEPSAQLMVVLGTNHKGYEENLSLGLKLHALLEQTHPGLMRPLQLRAQRFNQDLAPGALLIEVGAAGNTHPEAMAAANALARAVIALSLGTEP